MRRDLLHYVERCLNWQCTLQELEAWLLSHLQMILDSGDEAAIQVANEIDADFIQLGEGLVDETEFREHLERYARDLETTVSEFFETMRPSTTTRATTAVETIKSLVEVRAVVDLRLSHSFA